MDERLAMGEIFFALCKRVGTPVSLAAWLKYKYGEHKQLAETRIDAMNYNDHQQFARDYLVTSYLSKWTGLQTGIDLKQVALDGFAAAERSCSETNKRLVDAQSGGFNPDVEPILLLAAVKIGDLLKDVTWSDCLNGCRWGKGATSTRSGLDALLTHKIADKRRFSVTRGALAVGKLLVSCDPHWVEALYCAHGCNAEVLGPLSMLDLNFEVVRGNAVTTVPKDATKDRTIAAEPDLNLLMQLGVGQCFRKILKKRCGIDLDDQGHNQRGALEGSLSGAYATIDLKSASDTVSRQLVLQLFPPHISELLEMLRSPEGQIEKGPWIRYEKFSSMGNGFTFELETMIFWSLAVALRQHLGMAGRVLVYGDDIIVPRQMAPQLIEVLRYCGFETNVKKTHIDGYFRESCGSHYWGGVDVTPVYQKEGLFGKGEILLPEAYRCANRLIRLAYRRGNAVCLDEELEGAWRAAVRVLLPGKLKHVVPLEDEDDGGLALPWDEIWKTGLASFPRYLTQEQFDSLASHHLRRRKWFGKLVISTANTGWVKLPGVSWRATQLGLDPAGNAALLAYWLRQNVVRRAPSQVFIDDDCNTPFAGRIAVRRRGIYVSRRRLYPIGTTNVAWM